MLNEESSGSTISILPESGAWKPYSYYRITLSGDITYITTFYTGYEYERKSETVYASESFEEVGNELVNGTYFDTSAGLLALDTKTFNFSGTAYRGGNGQLAFSESNSKVYTAGETVGGETLESDAFHTAGSVIIGGENPYAVKNRYGLPTVSNLMLRSATDLPRRSASIKTALHRNRNGRLNYQGKRTAIKRRISCSLSDIKRYWEQKR